MFRSGSSRPENRGQTAVAMIGNICFTLSVIGVLAFIIMAATYESKDTLFKYDNSVVKTDEESVASNRTSEFGVPGSEEFPVVGSPYCVGQVGDADPIDCRHPEVFLTLMKAAIDKFKDIDIYRFGKPIRGTNDSSCHMAWRFRPKETTDAAFDKDYREFLLVRSENCTYRVVGIGDYHSGGNAGKRNAMRKDTDKVGFENAIVLPEFGDTVSESSFSRGKYLIYSGGGDRCKDMHQYLWSFMCMLGEAQYLNRTLVMDMTVCLPSMYTSSGKDEDDKDFRFYVDFEHLKDSASVLDQAQFWSDWNKWQKKDGLSLHLVEDYRITPMKLAGVEDALIMRKFGSEEPDNYWYLVCEGEANKVIPRPWSTLWKSRSLLDVASAIAMRMNWDYDSIHLVRGEKARNKDLWPNLDRDTSPEALLVTLQDKIEAGRNLYIATNERNTSFLGPLKAKYSVHFLDDFKDLWDENSEWYAEMKKLNNGKPVELDGYMRLSIDIEVSLRGQKKIETFNDLTKDCKDGINSCGSAS